MTPLMPDVWTIRRGRPTHPEEEHVVHAGPLHGLLEGTDLRYSEVHGVEVIRRLFTAVRDAGWRTLRPDIDRVDLSTGGNSFSISYAAFYHDSALSFRLDSELIGEPDGSLLYRFDGVAESGFQYNRIGICVLHPREIAGCRYRATTPRGQIHGSLPTHIGVQRFDDGKLWPLFPSYEALAIEVDEGMWAHFEFEGDLYEMEDQRNWTDASFKTYSTPLTQGWPHEAAPGDRIAQALRVTFSGSPRPRRAEAASRVTLGETGASELPRLGLGLSSDGDVLSTSDIDRLKILGPSHLRVDLHLATEDWRGELARAEHESVMLGCGLELALFFTDDAEAELGQFASLVASVSAPIERLLVFNETEPLAQTSWVTRIRQRLTEPTGRAAVFSGTDGWFADLNRARPDANGLDGFAYSICATVHADDDRSVCETPAAQGDTVRSARAIYGDLPIVVSPVTFRPRSWPFGNIDDPRGLPFQVDERQCALLGAAWTASSIKHLTEAGAASITYFETTGWRGVMESSQSSRDRDGFGSIRGGVYPLYHVLADVSEFRSARARIVSATSSQPLSVETLAVRTHSCVHLLVANLTATRQECTIDGFGEQSVTVRILDETTAGEAMGDPLGFRTRRHEPCEPRGRLDLTLKPYALMRLDAELGPAS